MVGFPPVAAIHRWLSRWTEPSESVETSRKSGTDPVTIGSLEADETEQAGAVLAAAFRTENFTTAAFGGYDDRTESAFGTLMARRMDSYLAHSQPLFVARDGDTVVGVVILVRPSSSLPAREMVRALLGTPTAIGRLFGRVDPRQPYRVLDLHEPPAGVTDSHYDLKYIAVDPRRQGEGIGGALLSAVGDLVDSDPGASGCYLVTANESNRRLYERYGYEVIETRSDETVRLAEGPLRAYHMVRPAELTQSPNETHR